jgi:hypothetical protein
MRKLRCPDNVRQLGIGEKGRKRDQFLSSEAQGEVAHDAFGCLPKKEPDSVGKAIGPLRNAADAIEKLPV